MFLTFNRKRNFLSATGQRQDLANRKIANPIYDPHICDKKQ